MSYCNESELLTTNSMARVIYIISSSTEYCHISSYIIKSKIINETSCHLKNEIREQPLNISNCL